MARGHARFHISWTVHQIWATASSLIDEFRVAKGRVITTFRDSRDNKVMSRLGRKWEASIALAQAEGNLKFKDIFGVQCGVNPFPKLGKNQPKGEGGHGPGRNQDPQGRADEGKSGGARSPGRLDKMGSPEDDTDIGRPIETRAILDPVLAESCI